MDKLQADLLEGIKRENEEEAQAMEEAIDQVGDDAYHQIVNQLQNQIPGFTPDNITELELTKHSIEILLDNQPNHSASWTKYYTELRNRFLNSVRSAIEDDLGNKIDEKQLNQFLQIDRTKKNNQLAGILHVPDNMADEIRNSFNQFKIDCAINMRNVHIQSAESIPDLTGQPVSPDIDISITFPTSDAINVLKYDKNGGVLKEDCIYSYPSVTLDSNVLINMKHEQPSSLDKLREKCRIDVAVTRRIEQDLRFGLHDEQFLKDNDIRKIGSVIRMGFDTKANQSLFDPQSNIIGSTEFFDMVKLVIDKLKKAGRNLPEYLDCDHLHSHYVCKRDIFLTQDKALLEVGCKLKQFGIHVMTIQKLLTLIEQNGLLKCIKKGNSTKPDRVWVKIKGTENSEDLKNFDHVEPYRED